jgi:hypothetical protein
MVGSMKHKVVLEVEVESTSSKDDIITELGLDLKEVFQEEHTSFSEVLNVRVVGDKEGI